MDELAGINFLCVMEGQDYERALSKIVSESFFSLLKHRVLHLPAKFLIQLDLNVCIFTVGFF